MLPEVRMARVLDAIVSHRAGRLSCVEAGELLGLSERHFRRLRDAYEDRGEEGLVDRRRGRVSRLAFPRPKRSGWRRCFGRDISISQPSTSTSRWWDSGWLAANLSIALTAA